MRDGFRLNNVKTLSLIVIRMKKKNEIKGVFILMLLLRDQRVCCDEV